MSVATAYLIREVRLMDVAKGVDQVTNLLVSPEQIVMEPDALPEGTRTLSGENLLAVPGLVDLHVHFREPGFEHKETIATGSFAALAGGVTTVVVMPNTDPALDTPERVRVQMERSRQIGGVDILVAAAATKGLLGTELTNIAALKAAGAVAITDDGRPVMDDGIMQRALEACAAHDMLFMQHAEDLRLSKGAPLNAGVASDALHLEGQSADAEGVMVERDITLAKQTGARYHVLHVSTRRSLQAIRRAKDAGLPVTCEVTPHHLLLSDQACMSGDPNTKMNPPLRDESDRAAMIEGLRDGTIDAVASDHAPHGANEKSCGFAGAPFGVVGLETAFAVLLSLVHDGTISLTRAVELMTSGPARVLRRSGSLGTVGQGAPSHLCLIDTDMSWQMAESELKGRSKNSAFLRHTFHGRVVATFLRGSLRFAL